MSTPDGTSAGSDSVPDSAAKVDVADAPAKAESEEDSALRGGMVKALIAVVANVGVLTALLVYFGWARSERMASMLGIDEAILGMTVDEYMRRSVEQIVEIPMYAALGGLVWVAFDQWWRSREARNGRKDPVAVFARSWTWLIAVGLGAVGFALGYVGHPATFVAAPLVCTGALLLFFYGLYLRGSGPSSPLAEGVLRTAVAILALIGLFWTARNYAVVKGSELAVAFPSTVSSLPGVEVDSDDPLDIVAPGIETSCFGSGDDLRYHYRGLRLLESTGGNYFLISEEWTPQYGVVVVLPSSADGLRYTFVRDATGQQRDALFTPCPDATDVEGDESLDEEAAP